MAWQVGTLVCAEVGRGLGLTTKMRGREYPIAICTTGGMAQVRMPCCVIDPHPARRSAGHSALQSETRARISPLRLAGSFRGLKRDFKRTCNSALSLGWRFHGFVNAGFMPRVCQSEGRAMAVRFAITRSPGALYLPRGEVATPGT